MKTLLRAALVLVVSAAGFGAHPLPAQAQNKAPASVERSVAVGSWNRPYRLFTPTGKKRPLPLVVALHGGLNNGAMLEEQSGLNAEAQRQKFLVAYPDGFLGTWNAGKCCWGARMFNIDDVGFLDALIDGLVKSGKADKRRVYVTGFSNGGGMAYRYLCERAKKLAAVAVVSGSLGTDCAPAKKVSVLAVHGTADPAVPYYGGNNMDWDVQIPYPPVAEVMEFWRRTFALPALAYETQRLPDVTCESSGPGAVVAELCTIYGGMHEWRPEVTGLVAGFLLSKKPV